jgi:CBS domain-containing protein
MKTQTAADVMTPEVLMVPEDMTVSELADFLTEHEITGAPVVDQRGKAVGVVSVTDIAAAHSGTEAVMRRGPHHEYFRGGEAVAATEMRGFHVEDDERQVAEIMTPTIFSVPEETPVAQIAKTMIAGRIHRLLVTRKEKIVGIVTSLDLLRLLCDDD